MNQDRVLPDRAAHNNAAAHADPRQQRVFTIDQFRLAVFQFIRPFDLARCNPSRNEPIVACPVLSFTLDKRDLDAILEINPVFVQIGLLFYLQGTSKFIISGMIPASKERMQAFYLIVRACGQRILAPPGRESVTVVSPGAATTCARGPASAFIVMHSSTSSTQSPGFRLRC